MGLFTRILEKLGIDRKNDDFGSRPYERPAATSGTGGGGSTGSRPGGTFGNVTGTVRSTETQVAGGGGGSTGARPISEVDVMSRLEQKAAGKDLNWKTSIVDLLKLLDLDSSLASRKELADELGAPASYADGSAEMNQWLHKEVLRRIAANGGNIPASMLD